MSLTNKQRAFINAYVSSWNASEAARQAGYSERSAGAIGHENLKKPEVSAEIKRRVSDLAMSSDEVLIRLAEHARGDIGDFMTIENGLPVINFQPAVDQGKLHLLKKVKVKTRTVIEEDKGNSDDDAKAPEDLEISTTDVEFELYDAQSALVQIGRAHGLFTDKSEVSGPDGGAIPISVVKMDIDEL